MYRITDEQIEYILSDIRRNGVEMEDLQLNLLDHICCIIEQELGETDDFERFYHATVQRFYKRDLREIEEETIQLLTFKNYYAMRNAMIISGAFSVIVFMVGSLFKIAHWPGAGILLFSGAFVFALLFLPLMLLLKAKEARNNREKLITGLGFFLGIILCISIVFKLQHWPGANVMTISVLALTTFVFIPLYLYNGVRQPERRLNTILVSIVLFGITALQFAMFNLRSSTNLITVKAYDYLQQEQLLKHMQQNAKLLARPEPGRSEMAADIDQTCARIKALILQEETGLTAIPDNFEQLGIGLNERSMALQAMGGEPMQLLAKLKGLVAKYNANCTREADRLPIAHTILEASSKNLHHYSNIFALNSLTRIQMYLMTAGDDTAVVSR